MYVSYPPQNVTIHFINNKARISGAAIYASDMQQCSWLGENFTNTSGTFFIFDPPNGSDSPFHYKYVSGLQSGMLSCLMYVSHYRDFAAVIFAHNYAFILHANILIT